MLKRTSLMLLSVSFLFSGFCFPAHGNQIFVAPGFQPLRVFADSNSDREQDGLAGPVRRVRTETAKITTKGGQPVEGPRAVLETATYDIRGSKVDTAYFLTAGGSLTGKENYKYDDKGNIVEMTLHNADGSVMTQEVYSYEFDGIGNWTKMSTRVAVVEGGKVIYEPTETTYRVIAYYLEENVSKMVRPDMAANSAVANVASPVPVALSATSPAKHNVTPSAPALKSGVAKIVSTPVPNNKAAALPAASVVKQANVAAVSPKFDSTTTSDNAEMVKVDGEAPVKPIARGPIKPISGGLLNGRATNLPTPVYPEIAKRIRATGIVAVEVVIDASGKVISAKAASGPSVFYQTAERAALQARFSPTLLSGQPVKVAGLINYSFTLP
ncbi:MAG: TonB family protein [Pyrinomonadaceae bacterium]|nr:TonB family protein [Pyrinomonadaceae bacterium]